MIRAGRPLALPVRSDGSSIVDDTGADVVRWVLPEPPIVRLTHLTLILTSMLKDMLVIDADSHWCEAPDLFTKRAPAEFRDRVPRVEEVDGQLMWVFDGHPIGRFSAGGVIARDGTKESSYRALMEWSHDEVHLGAHDPVVRLGVLDECGID